jgi:hypothetical protein
VKRGIDTGADTPQIRLGDLKRSEIAELCVPKNPVSEMLG